MFSVFKQRNLQILTHSLIPIGFQWLNHQVHQCSRLNCKPIHLVIHPNCLWSHTSGKRQQSFLMAYGFPHLQNPRTDQFLLSLLLPSNGGKFVNSISHPLLSDSIFKWFVQRYIEWLEKELTCKESQQDQCSYVWRMFSQYLSHQLQMSHKQASSFSFPGHRSAYFYFLCSVFNVCKLGCA